jgi:hypothetical protein
MISCKFCNKNYKNKYTLKTHQTTAKICLEIQNKLLPEIVQKLKITKKKFICKGCSKKLCTMQVLSNHTNGCVEYNILLIKEEYENLLRKKDNDIFDVILEKDRGLLKIKGLNKKVTKLENRIEEITNLIALKPSVVNNNTTNNNVNIDKFLVENFVPITRKWINKESNISKFTLDHLLRGPPGIADYMVDNLLIENRGIVCTDHSRNKYTYLIDLNKSIIDNYLKGIIHPTYDSLQKKGKKLMSDHIERLTGLLDNSDPSSLDELRKLHEITRNMSLVARGDVNTCFLETLRHLKISSAVIPRKQIL